MSSERTSSGAEMALDDFEAIEKAVLESRRGRWFLDEYARRRTGGETKTLLTAIGKLENAVVANQDLIAERLGKALGLMDSVDSRLSSLPLKTTTPGTGLSAQHMKYFKQDEALFESPDSVLKPIAAAAKTSQPLETGPGVAKGPRLVTESQPEPASRNEAMPIEPRMEFSHLIPQDSVAENAPPKNRIVIIRHKADETIAVPLHDEIRASA
jgi:hypothetical protein